MIEENAVDFRLEYCLIDGKKIKQCVGQDFTYGKVYFQLDKGKESLDEGGYNVPVYSVSESQVEIVSKVNGVSV